MSAAKMPPEQSESVARGNRLRVIRSMLGLTRREAAKLCKVGYSTFQYWEEGRGNGVTEAGAKKILKAFSNAGLYCEFNWLRYGIGEPPQLTIYGDSQPYTARYVKEEESDYIAAEVLLLRKHCPDVLDYKVIDDGMGPQFIAGDYVAGKRHYESAIQNCVGQNCIVELTNNKQLLRYLKQGSQADRYTLLCTNYEAQLNDIALIDVELKSAAPVIWHRKPLVRQLSQ